MPLTARGHLYRLSAGKNTAEGTPNTTSAYEWSVHDGGILSTDEEAEFMATDTQDTPAGYYIKTTGGAGTPTVNSDAEATPYWWKVHLGSEGISGASDPWTHTISKASNPSALFSTVYFSRPDIIGGTDRWEQFTDVFCRGIELNFTAGDVLTHKLDLIAKDSVFNATAPTITKAATYETTTTQTHTMNGATLKLDVNATPASTTVRNIESGVLSSSFPNAKWIQTDQAIGRYLDLGTYQLNCTLNIVFQSFAEYANTFYGTTTITSNMASSSVVVTGALDFTFDRIAASGNARTLQYQATAMRWVAGLADVQPSGEAVRATLTGKVQTPAGLGTPLTVIAKNARSTVY